MLNNSDGVVYQRNINFPPKVPPKTCANPYFIEKCRCLSSVSLFFCRKALGLLTSSPLPSFLLSEGTHLKNENKVIVPVLFLKSLQMLSVDGRLIVRRAVERVRGTALGLRYNSNKSSNSTSAQSIIEKKKQVIQLVSCTQASLHPDRGHSHGTHWHTRRGYTFNGLFGMQRLANGLGSLLRATPAGGVKRTAQQREPSLWDRKL